MSASVPVSGAVSISIGCGRFFAQTDWGGLKRIAGSSISPARSSIRKKPRQTMSRKRAVGLLPTATLRTVSPIASAGLPWDGRR